jgi:capsular polysaccharide biosynthesis protein
MDQEIVLRSQPIIVLADAGCGVRHVQSLPPTRIDVPPLPAGHVFFQQWKVRETPDQGAWAQTSYDTCAPPLFVLNDVLLHASAGILAVGGHVIAETVERTEPALHAYRRLSRGIGIVPRRTARLPGTHVSVLTPDATSYEGALLTGLARLAAVPDAYLLQAETLLISAAGGGLQDDLLRLLDLLPSVVPRAVSDEETFLVERLVLPLTVGGDMHFHPCLMGFFGRLSGAVPHAASPLPPRIFALQGDGGAQSIRNEAEIAAALLPLGFTAVRTESLSLAHQIQLFRQAEAIVAPHGGALANLGFCRPGTVVVELMSTEDVNWRFRYLSALAGLRYDCVLGLDGVVSPAHAASAAVQAFPRLGMAA